MGRGPQSSGQGAVLISLPQPLPSPTQSFRATVQYNDLPGTYGTRNHWNPSPKELLSPREFGQDQAARAIVGLCLQHKASSTKC